MKDILKLKSNHKWLTQEVLDGFLQVQDLIDIRLSKELFGYYSVYSIHGIGHTTRVLFGTYLIGRFADDISDEDKVASYYAAVIHDTGRFHDGVDDEHGMSSAMKYSDYLTMTITDPCVRKRIVDAVIYHSISDKDTPMTVKENMAWKILKDADGVDRFRLGDCNPSRLRLPLWKTEMGCNIIELFRILPELTEHLRWDDPCQDLVNVIRTFIDQNKQ